MADQLTTLQDVMLELGSQANGSSSDYITALISAASAAVETYCGRTFGQQQATEIYCVSPREAIVVQNRPIVSIDAFMVDGNTIAGVVSDNNAGIIQYPTGSWFWPGRQISVTYTAGYILPGNDGATLPADIERATILWVKRAFMAQNRDPSLRSKGLSSMEEITYFAGDPTNIAPDVAGLLARHCDPYV